MEEKALQQRFHILQQEGEAAISLVDEVRLNYAAAVNVLKIEVEVLCRFMDGYDPNCARRYAELRGQVIHEINPEWTEPSSRTRTQAALQLGDAAGQARADRRLPRR